MNKIIEYKIVTVSDIRKKGVKLQEAVQKEIGQGWQPLGNMATTGVMFYQPMVKYKLKDVNGW